MVPVNCQHRRVPLQPLRFRWSFLVLFAFSFKGFNARFHLTLARVHGDDASLPRDARDLATSLRPVRRPSCRVGRVRFFCFFNV